MQLSAQHSASTVLAALTASAVAAPLSADSSNPSNTRDLFSRDGSAIDDIDKWCGLTEDLQTIDNAQEALDRTYLGYSVGSFIRGVNDDSHRWLEGIQKYVYLDEDMEGEDARGCATLEGKCAPGKGKNCTQAFKDGEEESDWHKDAWWIFKAVRGVHTKMKLLNTALTKKTISTGLNIPKMAEDFEASMNDDSFKGDDMLKWMQVALGFGGTGLSLKSGLNPIYGAATSIVSTVMSLSDNSDDDEATSVSLADVQSSLANMFEESTEGVERTLRAAMGLAWEDQMEDYHALPNLAHDKHEEDVANFLDTSFWLLDDSAKPVDKMIEAATDGLRIHIVDMIVQGLGYAIYWDSEIEDKSDCDGNGRLWMNVGNKDRCFLMYHEKNSDEYSAVPKDSGLFDLMRKWGIDDVKAYYQNSIDCARSKCDKISKVGLEDMSEDKLPLCYFSAPVKKVEMVSDNKGCEYTTGGCLRTRRRYDFFDDSVKTECPED